MPPTRNAVLAGGHDAMRKSLVAAGRYRNAGEVPRLIYGVLWARRQFGILQAGSYRGLILNRIEALASGRQIRVLHALRDSMDPALHVTDSDP